MALTWQCHGRLVKPLPLLILPAWGGAQNEDELPCARRGGLLRRGSFAMKMLNAPVLKKVVLPIITSSRSGAYDYAGHRHGEHANDIVPFHNSYYYGGIVTGRCCKTHTILKVRWCAKGSAPTEDAADLTGYVLHDVVI